MKAKEKLRRRVFETLLRPHLDKLYRQAYWLTRNRQDAEDIVQDVLVKLYPRCDELSAIEKLGPWLARVLHRTFIDSYRSKQRMALHVVTADKPEDLPQAAAGTTDSPATIIDIQAGLERLNADQRLVILLHDAEGYSLVELERILGVPVGTLKSRLHRGRAQLREFLTGMEPFADTNRV